MEFKVGQMINVKNMPGYPIRVVNLCGSGPYKIIEIIDTLAVIKITDAPPSIDCGGGEIRLYFNEIELYHSSKILRKLLKVDYE